MGDHKSCFPSQVEWKVNEEIQRILQEDFYFPQPCKSLAVPILVST